MMNEHNNIQEELRELDSPLADMPRAMPYSTPDGYFAQFAANIHSIASQHIDLSDNQIAMPYEVPAGYFGQLPGQVLAAVYKEEIADKKRVAFAPRIQWATAAVLALIISFGGYISFSSHRYSRSEQMLSAVPASAINDYMGTRYGLDAAKVVNEHIFEHMQVENKDIIAYLNETGWE